MISAVTYLVIVLVFTHLKPLICLPAIVRLLSSDTDYKSSVENRISVLRVTDDSYNLYIQLTFTSPQTLFLHSAIRQNKS